MVSSNIKDKEPKMAFLQKLITYLESKLNMSIDVHPGKIVSGFDAEKTNYVLQLFTVVSMHQTTLAVIDAEPVAGKDYTNQSPTCDMRLFDSDVMLMDITNSTKVSATDEEGNLDEREHEESGLTVKSSTEALNEFTDDGDDVTFEDKTEEEPALIGIMPIESIIQDGNAIQAYQDIISPSDE